MEFQITMQGDDAGPDLASLYTWLQSDPQIVREATVALVPEVAQPGQMGGAFEVINAVVADALSLGSVLYGYMGWRDARQRDSQAPTILVVQNTRIDVSALTPEGLQRLVETLDGE